MGVFEFIVLIVVVVTVGEVLTKSLDAFAARRSSKVVAPPPSDGAAIQELREQYERLAGRLDRLAEEQRFLTRLLEERPALPKGGAPPSERKEAS